MWRSITPLNIHLSSIQHRTRITGTRSKLREKWLLLGVMDIDATWPSRGTRYCVTQVAKLFDTANDRRSNDIDIFTHISNRDTESGIAVSNKFATRVCVERHGCTKPKVYFGASLTVRGTMGNCVLHIELLFNSTLLKFLRFLNSTHFSLTQTLLVLFRR